MTMLTAIADDGHILSAHVHGAGPTILVVPPGGGDATSWSAVAEHLADAHRVVIMNRRIYEPDAVITLPHTMSREVSDIAAVTRAGGAPVIGVGHSSGATALLCAAAEHPNLFSELVLYEPPVPTTSLIGGVAESAARAAFDAGDPAQAMRIHLRDIVGMPDHLVTHLLGNPTTAEYVVRHAAGQLADTEAIDGLGVGVDHYRTVTLPVTFIEGEDSPPHLRRRLAELGEVLPDVVAHQTLSGQGHAANVTGPAYLAEVVTASLH
ncbi:alpha/beta hydrolase [Gordonia polyisoprenivorans]|uniref:alpha/beta fold hydrolase n=1 Tax=Gordonia polyisoprenivorans TaxID=84595 RepID=UPI0030D3B216